MLLRAGQRVGAVFHTDRTHLSGVRGVSNLGRHLTGILTVRDFHYRG